LNLYEKSLCKIFAQLYTFREVLKELSAKPFRDVLSPLKTGGKDRWSRVSFEARRKQLFFFASWIIEQSSL